MGVTSRTYTVSIESERETAVGWSYAVTIDRGGDVTRHEVTLSWADHNYWSGGQAPPSKVVEALVSALLEVEGLDLPRRFDASTARRWSRRLDGEMGRRVGA